MNNNQRQGTQRMNPDTTARDPRIDPRPGDIIGFGRRRYYIVKFADHTGWPDSLFFTVRRPPFFPFGHSAYLMSIKAWHKGSKHPDCIVYNVARSQ